MSMKPLGCQSCPMQPLASTHSLLDWFLTQAVRQSQAFFSCLKLAIKRVSLCMYKHSSWNHSASSTEPSHLDMLVSIHAIWAGMNSQNAAPRLISGSFSPLAASSSGSSLMGHLDALPRKNASCKVCRDLPRLILMSRREEQEVEHVAACLKSRLCQSEKIKIHKPMIFNVLCLKVFCSRDFCFCSEYACKACEEQEERLPTWAWSAGSALL